jgi:hypothetical protein
MIPPSTELKRELQDEQKPLQQVFIEELTFPHDGLTLEALWEQFMDYCDRNAVDHKYIGKKGGFGRRISKYVDQKAEKIEGKTTRIYYPKGFVPIQPAFS